MNPVSTLIILAVPLVALLIALAKTDRAWGPWLRAQPRWKQLAALACLAVAVASGGGKGGPPGPTISNLRLLLAERAAGKLSTGQAYGPKQTVVSAAIQAVGASAVVADAAITLTSASNTLSGAAVAATAAQAAPRYYLALADQPSIPTNHTLVAEVISYSVTNGVCEAAVWFNVEPNSEPVMQFHFSAGTATNHWFSERAAVSSFPDTFTIAGRTCYLYYVALPPVLLTPTGDLIAPLQFQRRVAFGGRGSAFDLRGGLAIFADDQYYITVTGFRTNSVGTVFYFDNGRLAHPPSQTSAEQELL